MATLANNAWIPLLEASGFDNTIYQYAPQGLTVDAFLNVINRIHRNSKLPLLNEPMFWQYVSDRKNVGGLSGVDVLYDIGESEPDPTARPDAPGLVRRGDAVSLQRNTNLGLLSTRVVVYIGVRIVFDEERNLLVAANRDIDVTDFPQDVNISVAIVDDAGIVSWMSSLDLRA